MKRIKRLILVLCAAIFVSVPVSGEEDPVTVIDRDASFVGKMQLISSGKKLLNSFAGPQKKYPYEFYVVPEPGQPVVVSEPKVVSGYTPYFILENSSPDTCFYLSPSGSPDTPATDIVCVSDRTVTPCYFSFKSGYGGKGSEYCLTVYSNKTKGYQAYTITGHWAP